MNDETATPDDAGLAEGERSRGERGGPRAVPRRMTRARLTRWVADSPINLAVFRVVVGVVLLRLPDLHRAVAWSSLPDHVRTPPVGLAWALELLPLGPDVARPLYYVVVAATALGTIGLATRLAWAVVGVASLYLLAIPQFAGSVFHYHHLVWFALLLAASPSGDALSVDAWMARRRGDPPPPTRALAYGVPLRAAWLLIGVIFFFPGLHKLLTSGAAWVFSDNLRNQMYAKWLQMDGFTPLFRVDRHPLVVRAGALSVVAFELTFVGLVLFRRTRLVAVGLALAFHQATAYLMGLRFPALWLTYVVFVDWERAWRRVRRWLRSRAASGEGTARDGQPRDATRDAPNAAPDDERSAARAGPRAPRLRRAAALGAGIACALLLGDIAMGAAGISDAWPFACYPKFDRTVSARLPALRVELVDAHGATRTVPVEAMSPGGATQRWWAVTWSLMGAHERARRSPARWRAFWRQIQRRPAVARLADDAVAVRFYRDVVSTVPEERDAPPLRTRLLYSLRTGESTAR